ncbi:MAG: hypothetical protein Q4G68_08875 [Planctomycetia bacterium]|nr:hypothetical protein [Planctomycetia bacterium]
MKRRDFLRCLSVSSGLFLTSGGLLLAAEGEAASTAADTSDDKSASDVFAILEPFDGAILHQRHGRPVEGVATNEQGLKQLLVRLTGRAPEGAVVTISCSGKEQKAERDGTHFTGIIALSDRTSVIKATCSVEGKQETRTVRVIWLADSFKRYRFQIDDNIFFLRDIHQKQYDSIFDCAYLAGLRKLHDKYGTKFALNCFNSTPERDFQLAMMSDRYKDQWEESSDWLRLTFHAENEFPNEPYKNASSEKLAQDFDLVAEQLKRFAGSAYAPCGIVHWGTVRPNAYHVFKERDCRCLSGYFDKVNNDWLVSFQLPDDVCSYLHEHDGWYHFGADLVFSKLDIICNLVPLSETRPQLERAMANPNTAEVLDMLTHEQYFWPFYSAYIPDHFDRLEAAIALATENGYTPVWHNDGFYSVPPTPAPV